ncbi:MAG: hypothetical protein Q4G43_02955 [Mobilicoccus sp.]|nr:hypothetical protein [Mobilicoccus sp.]
MDSEHGGASAAFEQQVRESCMKAERLATQLANGDGDALRSVRRAWIEAELPSRCMEAWQTIWEAVRTAGPTAPVMTATERRRYAAMPDPVTLFRGCSPGGEYGWSWTLDREVAIDFAHRYEEDTAPGDAALLCTVTVPTSLVIAYLRIGGEDEVIIDPCSLSDVGLSIETLSQ